MRRREIVDAARSLACEQGWQAVTLRAVARRIGCSAPAIYQYFRSKEAVLAVLAAESQAELDQRIDQALIGVRGAGKRTRAAVAAFWGWAMDNPALYAVTFGLDGVRGHGRMATPSRLLAIVAELAAKRGTDEAAADLADRLAATAHGFVGVALTEAFPGGRDRAGTLLRGVVDDVIRGLGRRKGSA